MRAPPTQGSSLARLTLPREHTVGRALARYPGPLQHRPRISRSVSSLQLRSSGGPAFARPAGSSGLRSSREKAGGHYAAGLLLQLPAREVRFRCDSMPKV